MRERHEPPRESLGELRLLNGQLGRFRDKMGTIELTAGGLILTQACYNLNSAGLK